MKAKTEGLVGDIPLLEARLAAAYRLRSDATKTILTVLKSARHLAKFAGPLGAVLLAADVGSAMIGSANAPGIDEKPQ